MKKGIHKMAAFAHRLDVGGGSRSVWAHDGKGFSLLVWKSDTDAYYVERVAPIRKGGHNAAMRRFCKACKKLEAKP